MNNELFLNETLNKYQDKEGNLYERVTNFIHQFETPFDEDYWSTKCAYSKTNPKYTNLSKEEILNQWKIENKKSTDKGTLIHNTLEEYLIKDSYSFEENPFIEKDIMQKYIDFLENLKLKERCELVLAESKIHNKDIGLAGTADIKVYKKNNKVSILDWKTNKQLRIDNNYNQTMLSPLEILPSCEISIYTLQLSIYAYMTELNEKVSIDKLSIFHLLNDGNVKVYPIQYRKDLIEKILKYTNKI
jgi:hypothetical protein